MATIAKNFSGPTARSSPQAGSLPLLLCLTLVLSACTDRGTPRAGPPTAGTRESNALVLTSPVIRNPFYKQGGRDVFLRFSRLRPNLVRIQGREVELVPGRWIDLSLKMLEASDRTVFADTAIRLLRSGRSSSLAMKPAVYRTVPRTGEDRERAAVNDRLIVIRVPLNTLTLYGLDASREQYRILRRYVVSTGRPQSRTPIGDGFIYTKGPLVFRYMFGTNQNRIIEMVHDSPRGDRKVPMPFDKIKGLYINIWGADRFVIHSTTEYWNMGMQVSMGCIRISIPDMLELFNMVETGTTVRIVYDTVEIAKDRVRIYPDVYNLEGDRARQVVDRLVQAGYPRSRLDLRRIRSLSEGDDGRSFPVSEVLKGGSPAVKVMGESGKRTKSPES